MNGVSNLRKPSKKIIDTVSAELVKRYEMLYTVGTVSATYTANGFVVTTSVPTLDSGFNPTTVDVQVGHHLTAAAVMLADRDMLVDDARVAKRVDRARELGDELLKTELEPMLVAKFTESPVSGVNPLGFEQQCTNRCRVISSAPTSLVVDVELFNDGESFYLKRNVALTRLVRGDLEGVEFDTAVRKVILATLAKQVDSAHEHACWALKYHY